MSTNETNFWLRPLLMRLSAETKFSIKYEITAPQDSMK